MSVLEVNNLQKKVSRNKIIIDEINFGLKEGEVLGIIGPNGAGKTTLMKCLAGLINNDKGSISYDGRTFKMNREEILTNLGVFIEQPTFYKHLSAKTNLSVFSNMKSKKIKSERVDQLLYDFKLYEFRDRKFSKYSLGMKQRLSLVELLLNNPSILILDEPTNGLDPRGIVEFREYLNNLSKMNNKSIIISSHNLGELEKICDNYIFIIDGVQLSNRKISNNDYMINLNIKVDENIINKLNEQGIDYIFNPKIKENLIILNTDKNKLKDLFLENRTDERILIKEIGSNLEDLYLNLTED